MKSKNKLIRITTVPVSLKTLLKGQHKFMSSHYEVVGISSDGGALQDVQNNEGIRVVPLEMTRTISPLKDLQSLWEFYKIVKKEKPMIVHSHTPKAGIIGMLGSKMAGVPIRLHTVAGLPLMETTGLKRLILNWVEKITYTCSTKVYPNSKGLYDFILEHKLTTKGKLKIIGNGSSNGIDTNYFNSDIISVKDKENLKNELGILTNTFVFIFVGRLVGDKGINELIEAFKKISSEINLVKLILVGFYESKLDPIQQQTINEIATNKNIISVGFQEDIRPFLAISDCLAFPSYREGFPNVVMQAGAFGLPSIVTNINGCNEIIIEGVNGIIIPSKDINTLYSAMKKMLTDTEFTASLSANAREMIVLRYEQKNVWDAILREYEILESNV